LRGRWGEALDALTKAKSLHRGDPYILADYATALAASNLNGTSDPNPKDVAEALAAVETAIAADPKYDANYVTLGEIYAIDNHIPEAVKALREAIALNPTNTETQYILAKLLILGVGTAAAKKEAEQLLLSTIADHPYFRQERTELPHLAMLVALYIDQKRYGEAESVIEWEKRQGAFNQSTTP
jgi:cytochrome c-type biogenesis protein CcmH/NrfG